MKKDNTDSFFKLVKKLNPNVELVSEYIDNVTKCTFRCLICGKYFTRTPKRFKTTSTCRYCSLQEKYKKHSKKMKGKLGSTITLDKFKDKCLLLTEYEIDYSTYISRTRQVTIKHLKCGRTFSIVAKNFYSNPRCLCCIEDERRDKISNSLKNSIRVKQYKLRISDNCREKFADTIHSLTGNEYTFLEDYVDNHALINVRHNECGHIWKVSPNNFISKGTRCPYCFRQASKQEISVYDFVHSIYTGSIIRNDRKQIYPMELDMYIPEKNLAIEFNGTYWHSLKYKDKNYHFDKSAKCEDAGIRLIHIWEYEWKNERQRPILENIIKNALGVNESRVYARKCKIVIKESKEMRQFFNDNNIQGFRPRKVCDMFRIRW